MFLVRVEGAEVGAEVDIGVEGGDEAGDGVDGATRAVLTSEREVREEKGERERDGEVKIRKEVGRDVRNGYMWNQCESRLRLSRQLFKNEGNEEGVGTMGIGICDVELDDDGRRDGGESSELSHARFVFAEGSSTILETNKHRRASRSKLVDSSVSQSEWYLIPVQCSAFDSPRVGSRRTCPATQLQNSTRLTARCSDRR